MKYQKDNIFAKILADEVPAKKVYEDEHVLAFHTIEPMADVHIIIIPKQPYIDYQDFVSRADDAEVARFFRTVDKVAKEQKIDNSYKLITNFGEDSGQKVFHFHVHLLSGSIKTI
ncbi:HIT domain-containing protein [Rickettsiales bacterium]|nr:HIT domain-containing protein [Rickettsiales bacterium]